MLGFDGDFDRDGYGGGARVSTALPWRISADLGFSFLREEYANENLVDYLTERGRGWDAASAATPSGRLGSASCVRSPDSSTSSSRPATATTRSNVDLYDYDRWVSGLAVRIHTP